MRTWYRTDYDKGGVGTVSTSIPDRAFERGPIVDVNWKPRGMAPGWVEVTFLMEGPGDDDA
jgi:hypothetical protein